MAFINPPGIPIERGKIHEFANAIYSEEPLYHDEAAAKQRGFPSVVAPPTFTQVGSFFPEKGAKSGMEGLDLRFLLHGGQEFFFERPLFAGDVLSPEAGERNEYEKEGRRGGKMKFVDTFTDYKDQQGNVVLRVKNTLIITEGTVQG